MVPMETQAAVMNTLVKDINDHKGHPTTGYMGTKYMLDLLTKKGREDIVWNMALKTDFPSWSYFLRDGRTTITEAWTGGGSQNHLALGAAIDPWFYSVLAGINPLESEPGFRKVIIRPFIPEQDLEWVKASVNTLQGTIYSSWQKKQDGLSLEVKIPANTTATIHLPAINAASITEGGKVLSSVKGIRIIPSKDDQVIVEVGSGLYSFFISELFKK
jgi:alpha-L-rhamnosidase